MQGNKKQNKEEYEPTLKERSLLEILMNPENRLKTITQNCIIAECDRITYYRAFAKPEFAELYKKKSMELVKEAIGPVINAVIREAKRGSFQHGKIILEMAGLYTEKMQTENTNHEDGEIKVNFNVMK